MAAMTVIDHTEIGSGGAAYWQETGIPTDGTYDHLLIKASLRGEKTGRYYVSLSMTVNSVTSSVYSNTAMFANSSTPTATREAARGEMNNCFWPANDALADTFGAMEIWIPDYANTTNYKQFVCKSVQPNNSTSNSEWIVGVVAGLYAQTTAISSVKIASGYADDFEQYSTIPLYGISQ